MAEVDAEKLCKGASKEEAKVVRVGWKPGSQRADLRLFYKPKIISAKEAGRDGHRLSAEYIRPPAVALRRAEHVTPIDQEPTNLQTEELQTQQSSGRYVKLVY